MFQRLFGGGDLRSGCVRVPTGTARLRHGGVRMPAGDRLLPGHGDMRPNLHTRRQLARRRERMRCGAVRVSAWAGLRLQAVKV